MAKLVRIEQKRLAALEQMGDSIAALATMLSEMAEELERQGKVLDGLVKKGSSSK